MLIGSIIIYVLIGIGLFIAFFCNTEDEFRCKIGFYKIMFLCNLFWPLSCTLMSYCLFLAIVDEKYGISTTERLEWIENNVAERIKNYIDYSDYFIFSKVGKELRKEDKEFEDNAEDLMFERMGINPNRKRS